MITELKIDYQLYYSLWIIIIDHLVAFHPKENQDGGGISSLSAAKATAPCAP